MSDKYIHTEVEGRKLRLSNLDKVLYPQIKVTKAEVIQYYLDISEILLRYVASRPLTVIRFPEGIAGKSFYSKDKPEWTPEWIKSVPIQHEEKTIDYIVIENKPELAWASNLACLELHPMQFKYSNDLSPDFFVIDLDPDEDLSFNVVIEAALRLKEFLMRFDYQPFVKTSGGKGLHLYVPIKAEYSFEQMLDTVKLLARLFIRQYPKLYTLQISKSQRKGKILIDIYRNHLSNTTVAPYSLRGKPGAPISMPVAWDQLESLVNAHQFSLQNYRDHLQQYGDVWQGWKQYASQLHNRSRQHNVVIQNNRLGEYIQKRDFNKTSEPIGKVTSNYKDQFVIQLHDASNLHYDLRLEEDGILMSWAIPKGLPFYKGQKRLAIRTEDHPVKYLDFEGVIPKGQYGAGEMWIIEKGEIEWINKKENSFEFKLKGKNLLRTYSLFKTSNDDQWLITTSLDHAFYSWNNKPSPMLASATKSVPAQRELTYEVKWDGIRALIYVEDGNVRILSRNGREISKQFPELLKGDYSKAEQIILDTEIVVVDEFGRPQFHEVISRMHKTGSKSIQAASINNPIVCYAFDLISLDGINVIELPLKRRKALLRANVKEGQFFRISKEFEDGEELFQAIKSQNMEGIMAKNKKSKYYPGERSEEWLKIKVRKREICRIIGYTSGKGDRKGVFGALHLAIMENNQLRYKGKVGTGFDQDSLQSIFSMLKDIKEIEKPIEEVIEEKERTTWIASQLHCEIEYASLSSNGTYREPVFIKINESI